MTTKTAKCGRVRLQTYIDTDLARRLAGTCAARGSTETSAVQEAIRQYLDGTSDMTLVLRRLERLGREGQRNHRDVELLSEAFGIWVKLWFAHTAAVPEEGKRAARTAAETRYKQFVEHLAERFTGGKRFVDDLPHEPQSDEAEIQEPTDEGA